MYCTQMFGTVLELQSFFEMRKMDPRCGIFYQLSDPVNKNPWPDCFQGQI